ncbi:hypothetical protein I7103_004883 [Vibrio parahaemolyticus]|nr:hypothetical protein [Vibrio parahaemolyticus]
MNLPLINPYPMQQEPYSSALVQQQEYAQKNGYPVRELPELIVVQSPKDHLIAALNNFSTNILTTMIKDKLKSLSTYKEALNLMPNLSDVKGLKNYRQRHPHHDPSSVSQELDLHGKYLASGQVLFHGGTFPRDTSGNYLHQFITDRPLSTSLCAQVASVHSCYHNPKDIWVIRTVENSKVKAFVYNNDNRQTHGHESEILLEQGVSITLVSYFTERDFTIFEVELTQGT